MCTPWWGWAKLSSVAVDAGPRTLCDLVPLYKEQSAQVGLYPSVPPNKGKPEESRVKTLINTSWGWAHKLKLRVE